jgi:hypothetical protein
MTDPDKIEQIIDQRNNTWRNGDHSNIKSGRLTGNRIN